jgi:hypothetical protein
MTRRLGWVLALAMLGCGGAATTEVNDPSDVQEADIRGRGVRECADAPGQVPEDEIQQYLYVGEQDFVVTGTDGSLRRVSAGERPRETLATMARELLRIEPDRRRMHVVLDPYVSEDEGQSLLEVLHAEGLAEAVRCRPSEHSPYGSVGEALEAAQSYRR